MRILMLGNSFTFTNNMPQMLAELTGAEVVHHTRGGARLSEQLNPNTRLGSRTQAALPKRAVGLCGAPGDEPRSHHRPQELLFQRGAALPADPGKRGGPHSVCHLGLSEGRGQADGQGLGLRRDGPQAVRGLPQSSTGKQCPALPTWAGGFMSCPTPKTLYAARRGPPQ